MNLFKKSLINDKEFNRIFESLKVNEKLSSDFIKFSDTLKIKYLIKIFLIVINLLNNIDQKGKGKSV